jgi:hypothetical protein
MAPDGHIAAHAGLPPHSSHLKAFFASLVNNIAPKGQASTHFPQPMHVSRSMTTVFVLSRNREMAFVGQLDKQGASAHCLQVETKL